MGCGVQLGPHELREHNEFKGSGNFRTQLYFHNCRIELQEWDQASEAVVNVAVQSVLVLLCARVRACVE